MAQDTDTETTQTELTSIRQLLEELVAQNQERIDAARDADSRAGLGANGVSFGQQAAEAFIKQIAPKLGNQARDGARAKEAMNNQIKSSNRFTSSINSAARVFAQFSENGADLFFGDGQKFLNMYGKLNKTHDAAMIKFWDGAKLIQRASQSPTGFGAVYNLARGSWKMGTSMFASGASGASMLGAAGAAAGAAVSAGVAVVGYVIADQIGKMIKENKDILFDSFGASRQVALGAGFPGAINGSGFSAQDYITYRNQMRLRGVRNDAQALADIRGLSQSGIAGMGMTDAVSAAWSKQTYRAWTGREISDDYLGRLYRSTQGNPYSSGMFNSGGYFNAAGIVAGLSALVNFSRDGDPSRAGASMGDLADITESLTKHFIGMNQSMPALLQGINKFSQELANQQITKEEVLGMFTGTNANMTLNNKLMALAFSGVGSGNLLTEAWKWNERARTAQGMPMNLRYAAQSALAAYHNMGGGANTKDIMMMFSEGILSQFGLGVLKNHPNMIPLLEKAAGGDTQTLANLEAVMQTEGEKLDAQTQLLDAIQNPVAHIRDFLFSKLTDSNFIGKLHIGRSYAEAYASNDKMFLENTAEAKQSLADLRAGYDKEMQINVFGAWQENSAQQNQYLAKLVDYAKRNHELYKNGGTAGA